jgi:hypothetical protein
VRRREKEGGVKKEFSIEELAELRSDLTWAAQKVGNLVIATLSEKHRLKHTEHYSAEDLMTTKKELELARFQLRAVTDRMLPTLQAILQETVSV